MLPFWAGAGEPQILRVAAVLTYADHGEEHEVDDELAQVGPHHDLPVLGVSHLPRCPQTCAPNTAQTPGGITYSRR